MPIYATGFTAILLPIFGIFLYGFKRVLFTQINGILNKMLKTLIIVVFVIILMIQISGKAVKSKYVI